MLRPNMVIDYAQERAKLHRSDFEQLLNGLNVGGRIIVGGDNQVSARYNSIATANKRLGVVISVTEIQERKLDPFVTYSLDIMAVAQMIMIAKNENFHQTVDQVLNLFQDMVVENGQKVEVALQVLRERADEIGHL